MKTFLLLGRKYISKTKNIPKSMYRFSTIILKFYTISHRYLEVFTFSQKYLLKYTRNSRTSQVAQTVKNLPVMQETQLRSLGHEDPMEKGMGTHSSILAWRIPRTEEPSRPQSIGSQRIGHNWVTNTHTHTHENSKILRVANTLKCQECILLARKEQVRKFFPSDKQTHLNQK